MLNLELARIVIAERRRTTDERVRQGQLRRAVAERQSAIRGSAPAEVEPNRCPEVVPGGSQALGPSR